MTAAPDLRDALAVPAPSVSDADLPRSLASADNAAEDLALALSVAAKVNDPDTLREVAVEALVAAEGLEAAAHALETRFQRLRRDAKALVAVYRWALAADLAASDRKRASGSSHGAALEAGSLRVVLQNGVDGLPDAYIVTTRKPDLAKIAKALAAGETVPGASRERGPPGVRLSLLRETANQGT